MNTHVDIEAAEFELVADFTPMGDQPAAISALTSGVLANKPYQVLLGVTGSGKTFTMANVICNTAKPTLIIAPNKTLAAQLFYEFKSFFPHNAVEYFVSYYDYYQPEAYIPTTDTYIQKDSAINEMIDRLRHSATRSVLTRRDVVVVASVSCIFGLGAPEDYLGMRLELAVGTEMPRDKLLKSFVQMQYTRNDVDFYRGVFRVRGDRVEIFPSYETEKALRIDLFGDEIEAIAEFDPLRGDVIKRHRKISLFPASHFVTEPATLRRAIEAALSELKTRVAFFRDSDKLLEAQRIEERTNFDVEMMLEIGYCNGIENYSRHLTGREPGEPPPTLIDYFPDDFLVIIDESHIGVPQLNGMYKGDRSRKETLVNYGFRLPSALDNRPLRFDEFTEKVPQIVYVSATPSNYELKMTDGEVVEQIVRPTGLMEPEIEVADARYQVDDLYTRIRERVEKNERVLVTTLTKRLAEDITEYYEDLGIRVRYLHSDIKTMERMNIIRDLRSGEFDVLVGINLLREGLDIPEVSLVAILGADKTGFLRSVQSLVQTCGRASRNVNGQVIMYAQIHTDAMTRAMSETDRRRNIQSDYNKAHGITPMSVKKGISNIFESFFDDAYTMENQVAESTAAYGTAEAGDSNMVDELEKEMLDAASNLEFEKAAKIRDKISAIQKRAP